MLISIIIELQQIIKLPISEHSSNKLTHIFYELFVIRGSQVVSSICLQYESVGNSRPLRIAPMQKVLHICFGDECIGPAMQKGDLAFIVCEIFIGVLLPIFKSVF
jgi:hypothetical protein